MRIMRELKQQEEGQNQPGRGLFFGNSPATIGAYPMFNPQIGDRGKLFGDVIDIRHCSGNPLAKYIIRGPITCLLSCGLWAKVPQTVVYPCKTNAISNPFTQYIILGGMINQEPRKWKSCVGLPKIGFHDDFLLAALVASERTSICSNLGENSNRQR
jgi:hypothetical protein